MDTTFTAQDIYAPTRIISVTNREQNAIIASPIVVFTITSTVLGEITCILPRTEYNRMVSELS